MKLISRIILSNEKVAFTRISFFFSENMMEDAMRQEKSEASSSSKSYEMLKIESYPTSGHTSDDGVEVITNTSSDIEVISSPVLSEHGRFKANNQKLIQSKINSSPSKDGNAMKRKIRGEIMIMKKKYFSKLNTASCT